MIEPHFRYATAEDVPKVTALIERAYRGPEAEKGWANEAHLLTGPRTTEAEIAGLIADHDSRFVLAELADPKHGDVLGTPHKPVELAVEFLHERQVSSANGHGHVVRVDIIARGNGHQSSTAVKSFKRDGRP